MSWRTATVSRGERKSQGRDSICRLISITDILFPLLLFTRPPTPLLSISGRTEQKSPPKTARSSCNIIDHRVDGGSFRFSLSSCYRRFTFTATNRPRKDSVTRADFRLWIYGGGGEGTLTHDVVIHYLFSQLEDKGTAATENVERRRVQRKFRS